MQFGFLGINFNQAGLDIRDKTSFTDVKKMELFQRAEEIGVDQCMVLSTCNRSEVYFFYEEERQREEMRLLYAGMFPEVEICKYLEEKTEEDAVSYLFRVTAGLESMVLGEDQILGQVKEALDFARTMGYSKKEMNKVVRDAVTCAKRIKTEWKVSERPLSVSYIGIQKLQELFGIEGKTVLVIGSGKTAVLALKYIYEYGAGKVYVCNRTMGHAKELQREFPDACIVEYGMRYECIPHCDIVVSATASPHLVIQRENVCIEKSMVFLDLAAPRDIDTGVAEDPRIRLMNLDSLQSIAKENLAERKRLLQESSGLIEQLVQETGQWLLQSRMDATIQSLQQRCEEIVADSCDYLNRKIDLSHREQKLVKKVLHASLHRLLREPIQELKQIDTREKQDEYKELVRQLFRIDNEK